MRKSWRLIAVFLFVSALLLGGVLGDHLLALTDEARDSLRLYTELITAARESYGGEIKYRELVYASIQGMLRTLDPHTNFLSPEAYSSMREKQQGTFYGLGIFVGMRNGRLTVITPIPGTPAARLGMRAGDVISLIEGEPTDSLSLDEAVRRLKGPKGTQVRVTLLRRGVREPLELLITRAEIPQTTVQFAYMLDADTGYIQIRDFSRSTGEEVARALEGLKTEGMKQLILDLRNNGGGLLDQAIEVADQFVPGEGKIVETRGRTANSFNSYYSSGNYEELGLPVVVLVNGGTASAAEILSGAIQDHDVGLVVGEPTWGKGLVQTVFTLPYGGGLAVTTARYYTPSGRLIQRDYTSYWDYYTKYDPDATEGTPTIEATPDAQAESYQTDLGRTVYGGGGITPDIHVTPVEIPESLQRLLSRNAFFGFAVTYANENKVESPEWTPDATFLTQFKQWIRDEELASAEEVEEAFADEETRHFAIVRLRYEVLNSSFGLAEGNKVLADADNQIQRALELFPDAKELLETRNRLQRTPSQPSRRQTAK